MTYEAQIAETVYLHGHQNTLIDAYLARPLGAGPFPGVVLVHHIPGWDEWYFETTRRLTHHGYATICPNLFHRAGEGKSDDIAAKMESGCAGATGICEKFHKRRPERAARVRFHQKINLCPSLPLARGNSPPR